MKTITVKDCDRLATCWRILGAAAFGLGVYCITHGVYLAAIADVCEQNGVTMEIDQHMVKIVNMVQKADE